MRSVHLTAILPIICLLLCLPVFAHAQNHVLSLDGDGDYVQTPVRAGVWRTYDGTDGLPGGVWCLLQDSRGYLWLGTDGGLCCFDGSEFVTYTTQDGLPHNSIVALCEDQKGNLWIGTGWFNTSGAGASCFNGHTFTNYTTDHGLPHNDVWDIHQDAQGRLWFATSGGLASFDGQQFTHHPNEDETLPTYVSDIHEDAHGHLWLSTWVRHRTAGYGLLRYDGNTFTHYSTQDGLATDRVGAIAEDAQGQLWFGGLAGISCYDGTTFTHYTESDGLAARYILSLHVDQQQHVWIGTYGEGVFCFDGQRFTHYTPQDGLLDAYVIDILQDQEEQLWFAHRLNGVSSFDEQSVRLLSTHDVGWDFIQDTQGNIWFTDSANHLFQLVRQTADFSSESVLLRRRSYPSLALGLLQDSAGALWVGTSGDGLYRYASPDSVWHQPGECFTIEHGLSNSFVTSLLQTRDGTLWAGTAYGDGNLCRFDGERFESIQTPQQTMFQLLEDSQGQVWLGSYMGGGLSCWDGNQLVTYTMSDGLPDDRVQSLVEDTSENLWIGTARGVCRFDGETFHVPRWLAPSHHECSAMGVDGHLWFGTLGRGIYRYDGQHFQQLTMRDGLPNNSVTGLIPQSDGSMLIGTHRGVVRYMPTATHPPGIEIREVIADQVYGYPVSVKLTSAQAGLVTISYQGLSLATRQMRYSYLLDGYESEWQDTWERQVRYAKLPVGEYTFQVVAISRDLVVSEEPARVYLSIVPPFYLRTIFLLPTVGGSSVVLMIAIVASVLAVQRRRRIHAYERYAAQELQDARQMQMSLMPEHAPIIEGTEIAGKCVTANTVGGDFFDYLAGNNHRVGLVVADVSGKAMRGAMNAVHTSGIVRMAAKDTSSPAELMTEVNEILTTSMESDMNVTMVIELLDTQAMTLTVANAAHHAYPLLVRDGEVTELRSRGLPLGMRAGVEYREETFHLQPGDTILLMTDGIIEARDAEGNMYGGSGRLEQVLPGFTMDMSAENMVDALIQDAIDYSAGKREDDCTVLVAKVL